MVRQGTDLIRRRCPACGDWRNFRMVSVQTYFTLFFVPLFPLGAARQGYSCVSCGLIVERSAAENGARPAEEEREGGQGLTTDDSAGEMLVVQCPRCDGRMKVPLRPRGFTAVCPHCAKEFRVKGQREPVPEGKIIEDS